MPNKILITGASSYLAHRLVPIAASYGEVIGVARDAGSIVKPAQAVALDLQDTTAIKQVVEAIQPTAIIHAAAVNPGDGDERMGAINHTASKVLAELAAQHGIRLVMISTDSVHSGEAAPYADDAIPDPINAYGKSKAAGEKAVLAAAPNAVIARTSLIYGLEQMDRGTEGFRQRLAAGEPLVLFNDVLRQPIWADSLSHALCRLATEFTDVSGTMNVVGGEVMSRAAFGLAMMKYWGINADERVSFRSGAGIQGVQMNTTSLCDRAEALGLSLPSVTRVLASYKK